MKVAAIGIGSNSVRMLVAELAGDEGCRLWRDRAATRLFAGLDAEGRLSEASMRGTAEVVGRMALSARDNGAETVGVFATSATRDAVNQADFLQMTAAAAGTLPEVLTGEEEAADSYGGAAGPGRCGVIDIGGGSTEIMIGADGVPLRGISLQIGAVRLIREMEIAGSGDIPAAVARAEAVLQQGLRGQELPPADAWVGTGGTFTAMAALARGVAWTDRAAQHGVTLTLADTEKCARELADTPLAERLRNPCLQPGRADIVVHGICILTAALRTLRIPEIRVSECGNLEGYVKRKYHLRVLR